MISLYRGDGLSVFKNKGGTQLERIKIYYKHTLNKASYINKSVYHVPNASNRIKNKNCQRNVL